MADQFQSGMCTGNWWSASSRTGLHGSDEPLPCSSGMNSIGNFSASSCDESISVSDSSVVYQSQQNPQGSDSVSGGGGGGGNTALMDSTLQMMGFHLSNSPKMEWSQDILHGDSSVAFKQLNQDFSLDQNRSLSSKNASDACTVTCQSIPASFPLDSVPYGYQTTFFQGLLHPDLQSQPSYENPAMNYPFQASYGMNTNTQLSPSWQNFPQQTSNTQMHLSNKAPFWNPSATSMITTSRSSSLPPLQNLNLAQNFEAKPTCTSYNTIKNKPKEVRDSNSTMKKVSSEPAIKRPRVETQSPLPTFKVRKEKLGDRITTLQQLVSPFGKTDTASVLFEAIEYIKFLHEQVSVLSAPYLRNGSPIQHQKRTGKVKDGEECEQDLRSHGLCLVPMTSIFPVTNETSADFWTPTFGGTYR